MSGVPRGILRRLPIIAWYGVDGGIYEFRSINEWTGLAEGMIRRILPPRDALLSVVVTGSHPHSTNSSIRLASAVCIAILLGQVSKPWSATSAHPEDLAHRRGNRRSRYR